MILDLLTPEAHSDSYIWAAALLAHFAIGMCLRLLGLSLAVVAVSYAGWEALQAGVSGVFLPADSLLDWSAVMLGALAKGPAVVAVLAAVALAGMGKRR